MRIKYIKNRQIGQIGHTEIEIENRHDRKEFLQIATETIGSANIRTYPGDRFILPTEALIMVLVKIIENQAEELMDMTRIEGP